ncbi:MAG: DUF72 domain-containing protein [Acetobacteraceae bacterium]
MVDIHVGIGGWNFAPWRGPFYPAGLPQAKELSYASRHVTSIEINATFYGSQKPASFIKWREDTPDGFIFSVKAPRFATHRRELADAGQSIARFLDSGVLELGAKLGPVLWQFPPSRRFEDEPMSRFLELLPREHQGTPLRHVVETRHPSFADPAWINRLSDAGIAQAIVDSDKHVLLGDITAPFVYARLERNSEAEPEGYVASALDGWVERIRRWSGGQPVADLPMAGPPAAPAPRQCFIYFISGDKVRAPAAAAAMLARLKTA